MHESNKIALYRFLPKNRTEDDERNSTNRPTMCVLVNRLFVTFCLLAAVCSAQDGAALFEEEFEYTDWLQNAQYDKSTFLAHSADTTKGVMIHWTIDDETMYLAVAAKAQGWASFGTDTTS